jgi:hypothetical protein
VTTHERSHSRATDPSPNRDEPRSCTACSGEVSRQVLRHRRPRSSQTACHGRTLRNDTAAGSVTGTPAVDEVARIEEVDDA